MMKITINVFIIETIRSFALVIIFILEPFNIKKISGSGITFENGEDSPASLYGCKNDWSII